MIIQKSLFLRAKEETKIFKIVGGGTDEKGKFTELKSVKIPKGVTVLIPFCRVETLPTTLEIVGESIWVHEGKSPKSLEISDFKGSENFPKAIHAGTLFACINPEDKTNKTTKKVYHTGGKTYLTESELIANHVCC